MNRPDLDDHNTPRSDECSAHTADHGGFKFIAYVLTILWDIYSSLNNMRCLHILPHITSVFCERPHTSSIVQDPSAFLICIFIMKSCVSNIIFFKSCAALCLQTWALAFLFWCIFFILRGIILFLSCAALCLRTCAHLHSSSDIINKWLIIMHTLAFPFWLYFYFYFMRGFVFTDLRTLVLLFK